MLELDDPARAATVPSGQCASLAARSRAVSAQARENREFVRRLLREKEPAFAAALAEVEREWCGA